MDDNSLQIVIQAKDQASADVEKVKKGIDDLASTASKNASSALKSFADSVDSAFSKAADVAKKYGTTAATAVIGATTFAVKSASDIQMLRQSFDTMLGSAEKGKKLFSDLQSMANVTPFETGDLDEATQTLLSFGVSNEKVLPSLQLLGDVSLGNRDKFDRLAYAYAQTTAKGKLMGDQVMMMTEAGFNPLQVISEKTGRSMEDLSKAMEKGQISAKMVEDAFKTATAEGGKFHDGMENGSKTLQGTMSTLTDNVKIAARGMIGLSETGDVVKGGLFDKLSQGVQTAIDYLNKNKDKIIEVGTSFVTFATDACVKVYDAFRQIWDVSQKIDEWFAKNKTVAELLTGAVMGLATALGILRVALLVDGAITAVTAFTAALGLSALALGGILAGIAAVGAAVYWLYKHWDDFRVGMAGIVEAFKKQFAEMGENARDLADKLSYPFRVAKEWVNNLEVGLTNLFKKISGSSEWKALTSVVGGVKSGIQWIQDRSLTGSNAAGTDYWQGGQTWVGERGPELVTLPKGSQITPAGQAGGIGGINITIQNVYGTDAQSARSLAEEVMRQLSRSLELNRLGVTP